MTTVVHETESLELLVPFEESDDPNKRTHVISPPENTHIFKPGMEAQDIIDIARLTGDYVVALCGHRFRPVLDPQKYDACKPCLDVATKILGA